MTCIDLKTRASLITLYNEKQRHYHTLEHVYDCLIKLEEYSSAVQLGNDIHEMIEAVLWFHDAVYIPKSKRNEENSSELFMMTFGTSHGLSLNTIATISRAILCTKTHKPQNEVERVVCDIDLSILGSNQIEYERYFHNIEQEYNFVPFEKFVIGRKTFLNNMLQKSEIFTLPYFKNLYEEQAKKNMALELSNLL